MSEARDEAAAEAAGAALITFTEADLRAHIDRHHPLCPEEIRRALIERIVSRDWTGRRIGEAVGIMATTFVRHNLTDYDRLRKVGRLRRDEARLVVQGEVADIVASWSGNTKPLTVEERAARRTARNRAHSRRRKRAKARRRRRAARRARAAAQSGDAGADTQQRP